MDKINTDKTNSIIRDYLLHKKTGWSVDEQARLFKETVLDTEGYGPVRIERVENLTDWESVTGEDDLQYCSYTVVEPAWYRNDCIMNRPNAWSFEEEKNSGIEITEFCNLDDFRVEMIGTGIIRLTIVMKNSYPAHFILNFTCCK